MFITLEGGEGSGKSTQLRLLTEALARAGAPHLCTREPGGTPEAESIRALLVEGEANQWDAYTETLLFMAARVDHVRKVILPALREGTLVICDRFMDSTFAYQGAGKGVEEDFLHLLHRFTLEDFRPDLTLILDIDPEEGLRRAQARRGYETRFEAMDMEFHHRVRAAFLTIARHEPQRCAVIDASAAQEAVHREIMEHLRQRGMAA